MTKEEMYELMNANLGFYLATVEGCKFRFIGALIPT